MKKLFKEHSIYYLLLVLAEIVLSVVSTIAFVYTDSLSYANSLVYEQLGLETVMQNLYSSSFWALILVTIAMITIMSITTVVFKKIEYAFMGILGWVYLFILSLNFTKPVGEIISTSLMFIPIIILNIICYKKEKAKLNPVTNKKKVSKK